LDIYADLKGRFLALIEEHNLGADDVMVRTKLLSVDEAIGNPEDRDYPLIKGRARIMQAEFRGACGQAFTDMFGNFDGKLIDIANMELKNNYRRAIYIASLNAVMRSLGMIEQTVHCKDNDPRECSLKLADYVAEKYGSPRIAMVGLQPRMVEALSQKFDIKVTDLDAANIGAEKYGVTIYGPEKTKEHLEWCDLAITTGSTIVNNTIGDFLGGKPVIFFGVTISGAARLLGLEKFCYCGR
jgi:hypothetical protein